MRFFPMTVIIVFFLTVFSCTTGKNNTSGDYVIKYINMNSIYEYVFNNSNEAQDIKRKIDSMNKKIDELDNSGVNISKTELVYYKGETAKLKEQENKLKSEFYARIKTAVNNIAVKYNADFILNSGDGVVYSRPAYDLTNEVIKDLKSINERTSPVYK